MFDKDITIHGRHATRMKTLSATFDEDGNAFFARNLDVYMIAPVIGLFYEKKRRETVKVAIPPVFC